MQNLSEVWRDASPSERAALLQELEYSEANSQGRPPARIVPCGMKQNEMGLYDGKNININSELLSKDSPEEALSTYFHEERHAQQHNEARFPELSDNPAQAYEWKNNFDNYIKPEEDFRGYWNQPVEADAREYAAKRMPEFESQNMNMNLKGQNNTEGYESIQSDNQSRKYQDHGLGI